MHLITKNKTYFNIKATHTRLILVLKQYNISPLPSGNFLKILTDILSRNANICKSVMRKMIILLLWKDLVRKTCFSFKT